jgi:phosphoribosylglycinamide formyltransferase-1
MANRLLGPASSFMTDSSVSCLGILASHRGSNAIAVIRAAKRGEIPIRVGVVISNNSDAPVLAGAREWGVPTHHLSRHTHPEPVALDEAMVAALSEHGVDIVLLAGYFRPLGDAVLRALPDRVMNLHPSLAPRHTGFGMVGRAVHEDVLRTGDRVSGVTLHMVQRPYVPGPTVRQAVVPLHSGDTVDSLERRVLEWENRFIVECMRDIACGQLPIPSAMLSTVGREGPS